MDSSDGKEWGREDWNGGREVGIDALDPWYEAWELDLKGSDGWGG